MHCKDCLNVGECSLVKDNKNDCSRYIFIRRPIVEIDDDLIDKDKFKNAIKIIYGVKK